MSRQTEYDKVDLLGVEVDAITHAEAIAYIVDRASNPSTKPMYVVKPYVEFLDRAARDSSIRTILNGAELVLADGIALVWAANYLYAGKRTFWRFWKSLTQIVFTPTKLYWPLDKSLAGINFTWPMLQGAATQKLRVYLVGTSSTDQITHVAKTIQKQLADLLIVGVHSGRDTSVEPGKVTSVWMDRLTDQIEASDADLILVGMGFPLQEEVIMVLAGKLSHGVLVGEGGTFDYEQFGGTHAKAPSLMQRLGLEWLWRLIIQPSRWRRQLAVPRFIRLIWRSR